MKFMDKVDIRRAFEAMLERTATENVVAFAFIVVYPETVAVAACSRDKDTEQQVRELAGKAFIDQKLRHESYTLKREERTKQ